MGEVEGGRVVKLDSGTLEIGNAARDDEGEYKCRVANAAGEQFHTIRLNVTSELLPPSRHYVLNFHHNTVIPVYV